MGIIFEKVKHLKASFSILILFQFLISFGQNRLGLPDDFKDNAFKHVQDLVSYGTRNAGTKSEKLTISYLMDFYKGLNLTPKIDTFYFEYFATKNIDVIINDHKIVYRTVYLNPYQNSHEIEGQGYCIVGDSRISKTKADSLKNKILFTNASTEIYRLERLRPLAIIIVDDNDLKNINDKLIEIRFEGQIEKKKSFNIYCPLGPKKEKEVLLGAHWDSYCGPGADDNASGVSVILELSKYFRTKLDSLPFSVKVVFFGAEELGLLGSKAYVSEHIQDTSSTIFYFNIDCVGDTGAILTDIMTGQQGKCLILPSNQLIAERDFKNTWTLLDPENNDQLYDSNIPNWFENALDETLKSTHHDYREVRYCGSDHNSFANKGFITTNMVFGGNNVQHCPEDNVKQVSKNSLELAGKVAALIIINGMKQYLKNNAH